MYNWLGESLDLQDALEKERRRREYFSVARTEERGEHPKEWKKQQKKEGIVQGSWSLIFLIPPYPLPPVPPLSQTIS